MLCVYKYFILFYGQNDIPLHGPTIFCLFIHQFAVIFVVSTVLAVKNNYAMNICVQVFMWTDVSNSHVGSVFIYTQE